MPARLSNVPIIMPITANKTIQITIFNKCSASIAFLFIFILSHLSCS